MNSIIKVLQIVLEAVILVSCGSGKGTKETPSVEEVQEAKTIHDIDQLLKDIPPPSLIPFNLKGINAEFNREIINDLTNIEKYKGDMDKMALNMGTYASDVSYLAAYGHEDDCIEYLKACHQLAEMMGDSIIYDDEHISSFRGHVQTGNKEEISKLIGTLFLNTSVQMEKDHHLTMAGLALTGSFIEELYQAVITIENFPQTKQNQKLLEPLAKIVLEHEKALRDIIAVLNDLPYDDTISTITAEMGILDALYKGDLQKIEDQMKADPNFVITKDHLRNIAYEVKRIREDIVK